MATFVLHKPDYSIIADTLKGNKNNYKILTT